MAMPEIYIEHLGNVNIYFGMGLQIVTGLVLGGLVGYDRERKMKNAGIKTNVLICIGATLYTSISVVMQKVYGVTVDPTRIVAQIVSGIGFLGAGAIMQSKGNVVGLTTAATIWVVAAIGVTIGFGFPWIATIFTVTVLVVLRLVGPIYKSLESTKNHRYYHVEVLASSDIKELIEEVAVDSNSQTIAMKEVMLGDTRRKIDFFVYIHPKRMNIMINNLKDIIDLEKVHSHQTDVEALHKLD